MPWPFWLALTTLLLYSAIAFDLLRGQRRIRPLHSVAPRLHGAAPRVSVIVAARDEERNLAAGLGSLLRLDYPELELIAIDDRSRDATGAILETLAAADPRLRVLHLTELPAAWLGKNHALWLGSQAASGELLLFTDADIVMEPSVLTRAVALFEAEELDHLALSPRMSMPGTLLPMFGLAFMLFFSMFVRPWRAADPQSRAHIGIGAFNLLRATAYRASGGHAAIPMCPDDDLKLGKLLKQQGYRQQLAAAPGLLAVEWYATLGEAIRGLEKNAFAGCDYRVWLALSGVAFHLVASVWPYLALLCTSGATRACYAGVVLLLTLLLVNTARANGARPWHAVGFPLAALLFCWVVLRTMTLNLIQGGIYWRGTFYPLEALKRHRW